MGKKDRPIKTEKQIATANIKGNRISPKILREARLTDRSLFTFKKQVRKFEKYIMAIKPLSPVRGSAIRIKIILITESLMAVRKVKVCWSSPFNIPSETLSRYIKGTMGDRATKRVPTSFEL